jgi:single-strand DNA-binding protein
MAGYNKIIMVGNLTRDPELRSVGSQSVCKMNIASNRQYKNRTTGSLSQEVCFVDVEVWGGQADTCKLYLQKGRSVLVEGRLKLDSWKDNDGNPRSKHSISAEKVIFLNSAAATSDDQPNNQSFENNSKSTQAAKNDSFSESNFSAETKSKKYVKKPSSPKSPEVSFEDISPFADEDDLPF